MTGADVVVAGTNKIAADGISDTGVVFATRVLGVIAGVATQACLAWFLAPVGRGEFAVCSTFAVLLGAVFGLGFDRAIQYQLIAGRMSRPDAVGLAITTALVNALVAAGVGWYVVEWPIAFFDKASLESFRLALLIVPGVSLFTALGLLMDGLRMFRGAAVVMAVYAAANVVLIVLLVDVLSWGVSGAITAMVLASIGGIGMQLYFLQTRPSLPVLRSQRMTLSYAARYYLARLGNVVNVEIGLIVLAVVASAREIGLFAAASVVIGKVMMLPQTLATVVLPRVGQAFDGRPELVARACRFSSLFVAAGLVAVAVAAPVLVPLLLSPAFAEVVPLVWLLALGTWARGVTLPISSYFIGINRPGLISQLTLFELASNVALIGPTYVLLGLNGAALGATLAYLISHGARIFVFARLSGFPKSQVWMPRSSDLRELVGILDRYLGHAVPARGIFTSIETADSEGAVSRQTILLPDKIVKRQPASLVELEVAKTRAGAALGVRCGMFCVPDVLTGDPAAGAIVFKRIPEAVSLWEFLRIARARQPAASVMKTVAAALASIHAGLALESRYAIGLPGKWRLSTDSHVVWLHGDFTAFNLLLTDSGRTLWVTDWATSDVIGSDVTVGSPLMDVAWFVGSLFFESHFGARRIAGRDQLASIFIAEYCRCTDVDIADATTYLKAFSDAILTMRPRTYERLRAFRQELIGGLALNRFAVTITQSGILRSS